MVVLKGRLESGCEDGRGGYSDGLIGVLGKRKDTSGLAESPHLVDLVLLEKKNEG